MSSIVFIFASILVLINNSFADLPSYVHVCHRSDPEVAKCIIKSSQIIISRMRYGGLPDLNLPPLEPLVIDTMTFAMNDVFKVKSTNITLNGLSDYKIMKLKMDIPNNVYLVGVKFPKVEIFADVEADSEFVMRIKGRGKVNGYGKNIMANVILKAKYFDDDGIQRIHFTSADLDMQVEEIVVHVDDNVVGSPATAELVNEFLNNNKKTMFRYIKSLADEQIGIKLLELINTIDTQFDIDEVFPE